MDASCDASDANSCEGAPLPGAFDDGHSQEGGTAGGSSGGAGGEEPAGDTCGVDHDCALGEDCIDGSCQSRCVASCQCEEGLACVDGYCGLPKEPSLTCDSDCDCTSGLSCLSGTCK
jgi:hypothetical protein